MKVRVERLPPLERSGEFRCFSWNGEFPCFNTPTRLVMKVGPLSFIKGSPWKSFTCEKHLDATVQLASLGGTYKVVYDDDQGTVDR
jgi:hypothetical protein